MAGVLACVDLSPATAAVADTAASLARALGGQLHLLHAAAGEPVLAGYDTDPISAHTRSDRADQLAHERGALQDLANRLTTDGLDVIALVAMGPTLEVIEREVERLAPTLLVVGSHGHGSLHHLLVGSVTEHLLRHAQIPVVVVPPADR